MSYVHMSHPAPQAPHLLQGVEDMFARSVFP
jgi:hypothetical protein